MCAWSDSWYEYKGEAHTLGFCIAALRLCNDYNNIIWIALYEKMQLNVFNSKIT